MENNKIGKLESFAQLLNEEKSIIIPKVQRDYAYGRPDDKARSVLNDMLDQILTAVIDESTTILDFVYGGAFIREDKDTAGLIPLDGQQRLTTLFLLFFYASLLKDTDGNSIKEEESDILLKFRYETRQSATDFCCNLLTDIRRNLLKFYTPEKRNLKYLIEDDAKYLKTYDNDPTIISMLNVLNIIEEKCAEKKVTELQPCLWRRLMDRQNVMFYKLTLDEFGLTDDLFIKMNARGKKLTAFEIFKSDIIGKIKSVDETLKDRFSTKMDTRWVDIAWDYTDKTISDKRLQLDVTNEVDAKYSKLFQNIFRLEYFRRGLFNGAKEEVNYDTILSDTDGIESIEEVFDTLYAVHKNVGFRNLWDKYFYFSDAFVGQSDSIRLFWKKNHMSVFEIALNAELSVPETVYFYALYLLCKNAADEACCKRCLRLVRNLITANVRAVDARTNKLTGFLAEVKYIVDHQGQMFEYDKEQGLKIDGEMHKLSFLQTAWNEEYKKQYMLSESDYNQLLKYENHQILNCSVALFMDYCTSSATSEAEETVDSKRLFDLLHKFEMLFDDNTADNFYALKTAFLDHEIEYMQCEPYMIRDNRNDKMRYFITRGDQWSDFFIKNNQRRFQDRIVKILDKINVSEGTLANAESYKQFDILDWRYYLAKYPVESNHESTTYGIGIWDAPEQYPLDLILLNSSQHSPGNLEWKMLTFLLWCKLAKWDSYQLDNHGCSPMVLTSCGSTIGFEKGKWEIQTNKDLQIPATMSDVPLEVCTADNDRITVRIAAATDKIDYIDLGLKLVLLIENAKGKEELTTTLTND